MSRANERAPTMKVDTYPHPKGHKPGGRTVALWVFAIFAVVAVGGSVVLLSISHWNPPDSANQMKNPQPATPDSIRDGSYLYGNHCQSCHGTNGDGHGERAKSLSVAPADLTDGGRLPHESDGMIFWKISEGHRPMPAYKAKLNAGARWDLVNYLRTLKSPTPN
jgi:mono/diheme cytochrome c family protein